MHAREIRIATSDGDMSFDLTQMGDEAYRARLMRVVSSVTPDGALADTAAVLALAADDPTAADGPAVCVGYRMGAKVALHAASALPDTFVAAAGILPVYDEAAAERHFERTLDLWRRSLSAERLGA